MHTNSTLVLGEVSVIKFIETIQTNSQTSSAKYVNKFTNEAKEKLYAQPIVCYVKKRNLGKSRILKNEIETISLLGEMCYIQNPYILDLFLNSPIQKAPSIALSIIFLEDKDSRMMEHLSQMIFLSHNLVKPSSNGKIDILALENIFKSNLPKGKKISDYIKASRKYSYAAVLAIQAKTFKSVDKK